MEKGKKNKILELIKNSESKRVTIKDVALELGVSRPTAEKILMELEIEGVLKRETLPSKKHTFKWWKIWKHGKHT